MTGAAHQLTHSLRTAPRAGNRDGLSGSAPSGSRRETGILPTCEEGMVVQAPLLVLMGADVKQVGFDGPVNEVGGKVEENHTDHGDGYGPDQLPPWVSNQG